MAAASVLTAFGQGMVANGFETITVSTTGIGITSTVLTVTPTANSVVDVKRPARAALLSVETNSIRVRFDGTDPTAAVGHLVTAGDFLWVEGPDLLRKLKMIRASADASVTVSIFR
jgi:hypothetical protein